MSKTSIALAAIVVLGTTLLAAAAVSQGEDPAVLLRAAIEIEEVDGNLEAAIGQYKHVIQIAGTNRVVAAQALLRLGGCYEKRGPEEARRAYEQLIRDYAEQAREVAAARQRLAALQRPAGAGAPRDMAVRRVLTFEGSAEGSIDAAAALFSLTDWDTGNLAVRELPGGNLRRLTNKGPWTASPEFTQVSVPSRDGRQIAYDWVTKEGLFELRVVALDGSGARVIHDGKDTSLAHPCDWSPDGTHILAVLASTDQHTSQAVLISVKDGSRRILASVPAGIYGIQRARISPDGRYVSFDQRMLDDGGRHDIFLVPSEGGQPAALVRQPGDDLLLDWSPDGRHILFSSDRTGTPDAWVLPVADGKPGGPAQLIKRDLGHIAPMGFARDGSFYYGVGMGGREVYLATVDPASGKGPAQPRVVPRRYLGGNVAPEWSPDGRLLLWISRRGPVGPSFNIPTILSLETGEERELPTGLLFLNQVRWSLDGRSLVGVGMDKTEKRGLCRIDVRTGEARMIGEGLFPSGLPDGKRIVFFRWAKDRQALWIRDQETGEERELAQVGSFRYGLSRDGQQLAYQVPDAATGDTVVNLMPVTGGGGREVFRSKASAMFLSWAPDGRHLLVGGSGQADDALLLVPVDGGTPLRIDVGIKGVQSPRLHPDGRRLAFYTESKPSAEVWVMENFLPPAGRAVVR